MKASVLTLLHEHNGHELLYDALLDDAKVPLFVEYITSHSLDIDTLVYEDTKSVSAYLAERLPHVHEKVRGRIHAIYEGLKYREDSVEAGELRVLLSRVIADKTSSIADLEDFLKGKHLNIDLIVNMPTTTNTDTIGQVLDRNKATNIVKKILVLEDIRKFRSVTILDEDVLYELIDDALVDSDNYDALETFYKAHVVDVDTLTDSRNMISRLHEFL